MPRYSIIMPVYNGSEFLEEAIHSVLNQTFTDFELLVIDDGSTDATGEIADNHRKRDSRIAYHFKDHSGLSETLNYGLRASSGEIIARIDADDRWLPGKLLVQERILRNSPGIGLIGTSVLFINRNGERIPSLSGFNHGEDVNPAELKGKILRNNLICSSTLVFKRSLLREAGEFDPDLRTSMDYDFLIRALAVGEGMIISDSLVEYRISDSMMTLKNRGQMVNESARIRLRALGIFNPGIGVRMLILMDIIGLYTGRLYYKITGKSKFSSCLNQPEG